MSFWQRFSRAAPYHAHFVTSAAHAWLALVTLGVGIAFATPLAVTLGVAAYGLGVLYLPDRASFRNTVDRLRQGAIDARLQAETATKDQVRSQLQGRLDAAGRTRWRNFSTRCEALQTKLGEGEATALFEDNSLAKVADSHLLLLAMDADIRNYLKTAESPVTLKTKGDALQAEIAALQARPDLSDVEQRLVLSKSETLKNFQQQAAQIKRMNLNLELAQSELQRLESQLSSLEAELISTPASQLSNRLGETLVHIEASQRVLQEGGMINAPDLTTLLGERA